jgi:hypothetical protein
MHGSKDYCSWRIKLIDLVCSLSSDHAVMQYNFSESKHSANYGRFLFIKYEHGVRVSKPSRSEQQRSFKNCWAYSSTSEGRLIIEPRLVLARLPQLICLTRRNRKRNIDYFPTTSCTEIEGLRSPSPPSQHLLNVARWFHLQTLI